MKPSALVPDDLWEAIEPLFLEEPPTPKGGRPRVPDRATCGGIIFVLRTIRPLLPLPLWSDRAMGRPRSPGQAWERGAGGRCIPVSRTARPEAGTAL